LRETVWQRLTRGVRRLHFRAHWPEFAGADWPEAIMSLPVTDRFHAKQGRSIGRLSLRNNGRELVVYLKRHYRLPWWQGVLSALWPHRGWSPALEEWNHLEWARREHLPVPTAAAAGEYIGPWGRLQSFIAVEELTGMLAAHEAVPAAQVALDAKAFERWKRGLVEEMARIVHELHRRRYFHKDLYLCHFYVADDDTRQLPVWRGRVQLIDLHRLGYHRWTWRWWQAKDLAQLLFSSEIPGVTDADRLHFRRCYWARMRVNVPWWLAWTIRLKVWNYRRHNRVEQKQPRLVAKGEIAVMDAPVVAEVAGDTQSLHSIG
jgi:Lipopolysaccharide kinase (Kdo/WaaP) family